MGGSQLCHASILASVQRRGQARLTHESVEKAVGWTRCTSLQVGSAETLPLVPTVGQYRQSQRQHRPDERDGDARQRDRVSGNRADQQVPPRPTQGHPEAIGTTQGHPEAIGTSQTSPVGVGNRPR